MKSSREAVSVALLLVAASPLGAATDLCQGLITDKVAHPMTALAKPALGQVAIDPQFGTKIRRITAVPQGSGDSVIKPEYSTKPAWNADETKLLLYEVGHGHKLYDGKTYAFIRDLAFNTNEAESAMWHATNPDVLYHLTGNQLFRYNVSTNASTLVRTFTTPCGSNDVTEGHMYSMSWDSNRLGLHCGGINFTYEISSNTILGQQTSTEEDPPQFAPNGNVAYWARNSGVGQVVNPAMAVVRTLDLDYQDEHAMLGKKANGSEFYALVAYDPGPNGIGGVGSLVLHDVNTGTSNVVVGQSTGFPYPPGDTHVSALTFQNPGWVVISVTGNNAGQGVLDNELVLANTNTNQVCRAAHVRTTGKANTHLDEPYWAEAHAVPSPSGTRIAFASDWGNGPTVDTYVVELPSYAAAQPTISVSEATVTEGDSGTVNAVFSVSLSGASSQTVTVQYATADNTAVAPSDYAALGLTTLTFTPGQVAKTVNVAVNGDLVDESNETFFLNLSNPTNATIADAQGLGTITDDDPKSDLSVTNTDGVASTAPGAVLTYTITVGNAGPSVATNATVTDTLPAALTGATWTCAPTGGATCTAAGAGSIADTVSLPVASTVVYSLTAIVSAAPATVRNTATAAVAAGYLDPNAANNSAVDDDFLVCAPSTSAISTDGRVSPFTLGIGGTAWYLANLTLGSSYSVEAANTLAAGAPTVTVYRGDDGCTLGAGTAAAVDTSTLAPRAAAGARASFTASGTDLRYRIRVVNGTGAALSYSMRLAETSLFSPAWSTNTTFNTYYSFQNTTTATVAGTLTLRDTTGAVVKTQAVSIPAGRTTSANTAAMAVPRTKTGTAEFVHNGPPGAILVGASISNFSTNPAYNQAVGFVPTRESR